MLILFCTAQLYYESKSKYFSEIFRKNIINLAIYTQTFYINFRTKISKYSSYFISINPPKLLFRLCVYSPKLSSLEWYMMQTSNEQLNLRLEPPMNRQIFRWFSSSKRKYFDWDEWGKLMSGHFCVYLADGLNWQGMLVIMVLWNSTKWE